MTPLSWQGWKQRFEGRGHEVLAPGWPGVEDREVEAIRRGSLGARGPRHRRNRRPLRRDRPRADRASDHHRATRSAAWSTQILLDRGLGAAGIGVCASPFRGMLGLPYSTVRVAMSGGLKNPLGKNRAIMLSPQEFHYAFTNTLGAAEAAEVYERLPIPGPARTLFQAAFANLNPHTPIKVNYKNDDRGPLLLVSAGKDHIIPASTSKTACKLQSKSTRDDGTRRVPGPQSLHRRGARLGGGGRPRHRLGRAECEERSRLTTCGTLAGDRDVRRTNVALPRCSRLAADPPPVVTWTSAIAPSRSLMVRDASRAGARSIP